MSSKSCDTLYAIQEREINWGVLEWQGFTNAVKRPMLVRDFLWNSALLWPMLLWDFLLKSALLKLMLVQEFVWKSTMLEWAQNGTLGYGNIPWGLMFLVYTFCLKKHYWLSLSTPQALRVLVYGNNGLLPLRLMLWPDLRQVALSLWFPSNSDILELDQASDRISVTEIPLQHCKVVG